MTQISTDALYYRSTIVSGFNALVDAVNAYITPSQPPPTEALRALEASRDLTWCYVVDGSYRFLVDGVLSNSLAAVITPDQEVPIATQKVAFQTTTDKNSVVIFIRTYPFTPRWGGLLLLHELSHVADLLDGEDTTDPAQYRAGEVAAYDAETFAANAVSQGKLSVALDAAVEALREVETSLQDLVAAEGGGLVERIHEDAFPDDPSPASGKEAGARHFFVLTILCLKAVRAGIWNGAQLGDVIALIHHHAGQGH